MVSLHDVPSFSLPPRDRDALLVKLGSMEDESLAMKVSLMQLVMETSATNKTLAHENWRLTQCVGSFIFIFM